LEQELEAGQGFGCAFEGDIDHYSQHVSRAFQAIFNDLYWVQWLTTNYVDVVTWHYLTRHAVYAASPRGGDDYFSGQIILNPKLKSLPESRTLSPYPRERSPYIGIFKDARIREESGLGGPVCILLPTKNCPVDSEWENLALSIPERITALLIEFPLPTRGHDSPLKEADLTRMEAVDRPFVAQLTRWMQKNRSQDVKPLEAINFLQGSLKVTLSLLRTKAFNKQPRSTFMCPAHIGGEEVGGFAFACSKLVHRRPAVLGESVSNALLSYLRLREDAHAHVLVDEQRKLAEAKRFFIDRLSHDLRHPINTLEATVGEFSQAFAAIKKQIAQINRMMDETILAVEGRDPSTLLRPKKRDDKVSEFLADLRAYFRRPVEEKGKQLTVESASADWSVRLDAGMVHEILENLIVNALKHGGDAIRVFAEQLPDKYVFHVQDNGRGIPDEKLESLFRLRPSRENDSPTTGGRGLFIAKMLAQAHGGDLELASPRRPTDFVLKLPRDDENKP
jgi:signal transduction histidine kinase